MVRKVIPGRPRRLPATRFAALGVVVGVGLAACAVNPATGKRELSFVGEGQEIAMGRGADRDIVEATGLVADSALQAYVEGVGRALAARSERPGLPWTFRVLDDATVNAFALPGGYVYVTRGILAHLESEAELAGVLGHEIGHITARHSVSRMSRAQLQQIGLGLGMVFSERLRRYGDLVSGGLALLDLKFSRDDESEADDLGVRYMTRGGYDPAALGGVFEMLEAVSGSAGRLPEWQSTHPLPVNRQAHVEALLRDRPRSGGRVERDRYLDHLQGLVYGADPRQGVLNGSSFAHPGTAFRIDFPDGWRVTNQRTVVAALSPRQDALIRLEVAEGADADAALAAFLTAEGVRGGPPLREERHGIRRVRAAFEAGEGGEAVRGEVAFLAHRGVLLRLLAYAPADRWAGVAAAWRGSADTFRELTDPGLLEAAPWRLEVVRTAGGSAEEVARVWAGPLDVAGFLLLNRLAPGETVPAGRVKRVSGRAILWPGS